MIVVVVVMVADVVVAVVVICLRGVAEESARAVPRTSDDHFQTFINAY